MSGQKRHSTANVVALLNRYQCPTPFHAVRARFMGSIVSPVPDNSPVHTIQELWGGKFPPFDSMDDLNHLLHVLMDGLWNRLTAHQTASKPFKLTRVQVKQTREGVHHYALLRKVFVLTSPAEIDGIGVDAGCFQTSCGTIFGAIISLSTAVNPLYPIPSGNPFDATTVASTTLQPGAVSSVISAPLSVDLAAGTYALVFGTGYYGATATGFGSVVLPVSNGTPLPLPSIDNQLGYNPSSLWFNFEAPSGYFFEVTGTSTTPEPSSIVLGSFGFGFIGVVMRRRLKRA